MSTSDLLRLNRALRMLSQCNRALVYAGSEEALLGEICRIVVELGGFRMAWAGYAENDAAKSVRPVARHGDDAGYLDSAGITWSEGGRGSGPTGTAIRTGAPQFATNIAQNPLFAPWRAAALERGYRSSAALPLREDSRVFGALSIYSSEPDAFNAEETKLLQELADDLAFGIIARRARAERSRAKQQLQHSEDMLKEAQHIAHIGNWELDLVANVLSWSDEIYRIFEIEPLKFGASYEAFVETIHPEEREVVDRAYTLSVKDRTPYDIVHRLLMKDGRVKYVHEQCRTYYDADGKPLRSIGTVQDVTERTLNEERIARLSRIHAMLSGINSLIVRVHDRRELFSGACHTAVDHGGFGMACVGTLDPRTGLMTPAAFASMHAGSPACMAPDQRECDSLSADDEVRRAVEQRQAAFCNDLAAEAAAGSECRKGAIRLGYRSSIALPLLSEGAAAGVLVLFAREANFFDEDEVKLLNELAADISFALDHIAKEEEVTYLAYYDVLTGLPNRRLFAERLAQRLQRAERMLALLLLDIERFRNINETLGRRRSDALLKLVAQRLVQTLGEEAGVARAGIDIFAFAAGNMRAVSETAGVLERINLACFARPFRIDSEDVRVRARFGIAVFPGDGTDAEALYKNAESALAKAKETREQYLFYAPDMNAQVAERLSLETRLHSAVEQQHFVLHYQPQVDSKTGAIVGLEALIRWNDPEIGPALPLRFIGILEDTGLIVQTGDWAVRKAVSDYRNWRKRGLNPPRIAVNVSPIQLRQKDFVSMIRQAIGRSSGDERGLDLELTESLIMTNVDDTIEKLKAAREMGIRITIDDFGTGYSSLRYIARLPVDAFKIDRSFIVRMPTDPDDMAIVSMIISLGHHLGLTVVAEGVESEEQAKLLRLLKCDCMQGFLFGRPMPAEATETLLRNRAPA